MPPTGGAVTVSVMLLGAVLRVADAPVPVTTIVYVPGAVVALVRRVSVEPEPDWIGLALNDAVVSADWPLALRVTDCATPEVMVVEMVEVPELPAATLIEVGLAA